MTEYKFETVEVDYKLTYTKRARQYYDIRFWRFFQFREFPITMLQTSGGEFEDKWEATYYFDSVSSAVEFLNKELRAEENAAIKEAVDEGVCPFCGEELREGWAGHCTSCGEMILTEEEEEKHKKWAEEHNLCTWCGCKLNHLDPDTCYSCGKEQ
jgi:hypothetical protein